MLLPTEEAHHSSHETKGAAGLAQRIHPKLIYVLVCEGVTDTQEVKRALKHYTLHVLCPESKPELTNRAYYPTTEDIRNHIYKAQRACQFSMLDQENVQLKIEQWQKESPQSHFHFRPYKATEPQTDKKGHSLQEDTTDGGYVQTHVYVHQEAW